MIIHNNLTINGHAVVELVEALCYNPEGRGFDSRRCYCNFSLTLSFRQHYGPGVDWASHRNEYQEYFLGVKAAGARADNLTTFMCRRLSSSLVNLLATDFISNFSTSCI